MTVTRGAVACALLGLLALANACVLVGRARRRLRLRRLVERTPTTPIATSGRGLVEVAGRVVARGESLVAPLSGRPCVHYQVTVKGWKAYSRGERTGRSWETLVDETKSAPFALDDGTGQLAVSLRKARLSLAVSAQGDERDDAVRALVEKVKDRDLRWEERRIEVGQELWVLGTSDGACLTAGRDDLLLASDRGERGALGDLLRVGPLALQAALVGLLSVALLGGAVASVLGLLP